jgi:hypothetical protein
MQEVYGAWPLETFWEQNFLTATRFVCLSDLTSALAFHSGSPAHSFFVLDAEPVVRKCSLLKALL